MIFYFASIFESGHIVEQERFESDTFDRNALAHYLHLINEGQDFGEDLEEVHLEYLTTGPKSAIIEVSSEKGEVTMHLLGNTILFSGSLSASRSSLPTSISADADNPQSLTNS